MRQRATVLCILFVELIERMTFYSINGNLVLFCTNVLLYTSTQAVTINLVFTGRCDLVSTGRCDLVFTGGCDLVFRGRFNLVFTGIHV